MTQSTTGVSSVRRAALVVRIGTGLYGLPLDAVVEVWPGLPVEPVPQSPPWMRGVVRARGLLIPLIDGATWLEVGDEGRSADPPIVCIQCGQQLVGLEVDEALEVTPIDVDQARAIDEGGTRGGPLAGVLEYSGTVIRMLDPGRIGGERLS